MPMAETERTKKVNSYQKQSGIKQSVYGEQKRKINNVGLGIVVPESAINGTYIDKKCPFTGEVRVHGRIIKGIVKKMKMDRTITIMKNYTHYNQKYKRYERRNTKKSVHLSDAFFTIVNVGDTVLCGEVRPISKTKRFVVVGHQPKNETCVENRFNAFSGL